MNNSRQAIRVKKLYDGTLNKPLSDAVLVFEKQNILAVLPADDLDGLAQYGAELIDCSEQYMTPGLIDAHVHLMFPGDGRLGEDVLADMEMGQIQLLALENADTALKCGVTTMRDTGSIGRVSFALKKYMQIRDRPGADLFVCGAPVTPTGGHCYFMGGEADGADEITKLIRKQQKAGSDFCKLMATSGGTKNVPKGLMFNDRELAAAVEEAHKIGQKITMHCTSISGVRRAVAAGTDGIEHVYFYEGAGDVQFDEALTEQLREKQIVLNHTASTMQYSVMKVEEKPRDQWTAWDEYEHNRLTTFQDKVKKSFQFHLQHGCKIVAGSDSGWRYTPFHNSLAKGLCMMNEWGMDAHAALHSATGASAEYLGLQGLIGTLKPGMQADFILMDCDPAKDITALMDVKAVYKKGVLVTQ